MLSTAVYDAEHRRIDAHHLRLAVMKDHLDDRGNPDVQARD